MLLHSPGRPRSCKESHELSPTELPLAPGGPGSMSLKVKVNIMI